MPPKLKTLADKQLSDCLDVMVAAKIGIYLDWLALENPTSNYALQLTLNFKHHRWLRKTDSEYAALDMACLDARCPDKQGKASMTDVLADACRVTVPLRHALRHLARREGKKLDRSLIPLLCVLGLSHHVQKILLVEEILP